MTGGQRRGKTIVMLVQNGVEGDSRVQKAAASAAAEGWNVTLLGRAKGKGRTEWEIGGASVRLLPIKIVHPAYEARRGWLREPLAYAPGPRRNQRARQVRAWHAHIGELKTRAALAPTGAARTVRRLALLPRRVAVKLAARWIRLRTRATDRLTAKRRELDSPIDRLADRFWRLIQGDRVWRRYDPQLWEFEVAFGKAIDEIEPDLIHANDFQMLGVGARAAARARVRGRKVPLVWDAHEYLPGMKPWVQRPHWHAAQQAAEREYALSADAVVTVSDSIAELLRDGHGLPERPTVVMNAPDLDAPGGDDQDPPSVREECGLSEDTPLIVYSGAISVQRGLEDVIGALKMLPGVHLALVVGRPDSGYARTLAELAAELGVSDRVHLLPYVPYWQVVPFLSSADVGLIPIHHYQNHELALITKFFEYSHARLPIAVSDVETMGGMVRRTGQGEVFAAEDPSDLAAAVRRILDDPKPYRKVYETGILEEWTWTAQARRLHEIYRRLLTED